MKTRALGFLLMVAAAGVYAVGCGSSNNNNGTGGAAGAGTGGRGGAAGAGTGGAGTGGVGTGGRLDAGTDTAKADTGTDTAKADTGTDTPVGDAPADTQAAPTFSDVYAILSNITTPTTDTAPGCLHCHDGIIADGGAQVLPHVLNFSTKAAAFAALVGVDSLRCAGVDGGAAIKRVLANNSGQSVLWQKLNQGVNGPSMPACDNVGMPLNRLVPADGGGADAGDGGSVDAGFVPGTHYAITTDQLATVMGWINAGAQNN
jgi:hypothetical protein